MRKFFALFVFGIIIAISSIAVAAQPLFIAYPPANHQTTADRIFFIGTAPPAGDVSVNGSRISRTASGHFAPSLPLQMGVNIFTFRHENREVTIRVTRQSDRPEIPSDLAFAKDSLMPKVDVASLPGEYICFGAIAPANATVSVKLAGVTIPLKARSQVQLPDNKSVLLGETSLLEKSSIEQYQGCAKTPPNPPLARGGEASSSSLGVTDESQGKTVDLGFPVFELTMNDRAISEQGTGRISILSPADLEVAEITADPGVARTGASTDFSRMTPLPKGTRATVIGREGEWLRLDYGAWIKASEVQIVKDAVPPRSIIRSARSRQVPGWTEVLFPLEIPVPVTIQEGERTFTLTLHNTTAQTDIIRLDDDPVIARLAWQQVSPLQVQYTFHLKSAQQWGYKLRYEGTTLVLSLKHPPANTSAMPNSQAKPLSGIKILIDPGHGGPNDLGAVSPTGVREKTLALTVSKLVRDELVNRGATVVMTREEDVDLDLPPRVAMIQKEEPAIAISLHYNALPDNGDAMNTKGVGTFWFHPQAHSLAVFLHNYLVTKLNRPSYGVFWNNLAMTRPAVAPSVLIELGFTINPEEFEWIANPAEQKRLGEAIARGITEWFASVNS
ncbi:MAG: N-acetylmuramoyl-L-alanine amidase [Oscillatoriaceae cyanobacterium Prado104]|jgi:N-acetylmuramoyl-L-alanine amidase|nr:N-acetylmuramoyl-L-alanine amidase [Oscillatoriaceae cyanobacterium Prado104]